MITAAHAAGMLSRGGGFVCDVSCCFGVTMWVHLNHGDSGLLDLLHNLLEIAPACVLEVHPYSAYGRARKRMRRLKLPPPPAWTPEAMRIRQNVESWVDESILAISPGVCKNPLGGEFSYKILCESCLLLPFPVTEWGRTITAYARPAG